jgi:hypothetical protein
VTGVPDNSPLGALAYEPAEPVAESVL